jgi:hypothetical protein
MPTTGALFFKAVTPRKLNEDAFRNAFMDALNEMETKVRADFRDTVSTWEHDVQFISEVSVGPDGLYLYVYTTDDIYAMVNNGTPEHVIVPHNPTGKLHFQSTFTPKTTPGVIGSVPGGKSGEWVHAMGVIHPGTAPRNFTGTIKENWEPRYKAIMVNAMKIGREGSGHAY